MALTQRKTKNSQSCEKNIYSKNSGRKKRSHSASIEVALCSHKSTKICSGKYSQYLFSHFVKRGIHQRAISSIKKFIYHGVTLMNLKTMNFKNVWTSRTLAHTEQLVYLVLQIPEHILIVMGIIASCILLTAQWHCKKILFALTFQKKRMHLQDCKKIKF